MQTTRLPFWEIVPRVEVADTKVILAGSVFVMAAPVTMDPPLLVARNGDGTGRPGANRAADELMDRRRSLAVVTMRLVAIAEVPSGVVTLIGPVLAPAGTVARNCVEVTPEKRDVRLLNETPVTLKN